MKIKIIIILVLITSISGYGMIYSPSKMLEKGKLDIGIGGNIVINKSYETLIMAEYSLLSRLSSIIKLGYYNAKEDDIKGFYGSFEEKILIASRFGGTDYLSLIIGTHYCEKIGIDASIIVGNFFKNFDNYVGVDFDINLYDKNEIKYPGHFVMGVKLRPLTEKIGLVIECGLPITSYTGYQFGTAIRYEI